MDYTDNAYVVRPVAGDRRVYLPLLLEGDESEEMIGRYLDSGRLYAGFLGGQAVAVCVVAERDGGSVEVKNLAVDAAWRRKGYGRRMLEHVWREYPGKDIYLGTGDTPSTLGFYKACGFEYSHRVADFFVDNYPHPITEDGVVLRDMVYLRRKS